MLQSIQGALFDLKRMSSISSCTGQEQSHENLLLGDSAYSIPREILQILYLGRSKTLFGNKPILHVKNNPMLLNLVISSLLN